MMKRADPFEIVAIYDNGGRTRDRFTVVLTTIVK